MARTGVTFEQVEKAAEKLLAENLNPTIEKIRRALGDTGSHSTISRLLNEWKEQNFGEYHDSLQNEAFSKADELLDSDTNDLWAVVPMDEEVAPKSELPISEKPRVRVSYQNVSYQDTHDKVSYQTNKVDTHDKYLQDYKDTHNKYLQDYMDTHNKYLQDYKDTHDKYLQSYQDTHNKELKILEEKQQLTERRLIESLQIIDDLKREREDKLIAQLKDQQRLIENQQVQIQSITEQLSELANKNPMVISKNNQDTHLSLDTLLAEMEQQGLMAQFKETNDKLSQLISEHKNDQESYDEERIDLVHKLVIAEEENERLHQLLENAINEKVALYDAVKDIAGQYLEQASFNIEDIIE